MSTRLVTLTDAELTARRERLVDVGVRIAALRDEQRALLAEQRRLGEELHARRARLAAADRQLELPELAPVPVLAQAEPRPAPTLLERLTLAEPVRCLLTRIEDALSPGALALYRELDNGPGPSAKLTSVEGLDLELVFELCAFHLVVVHTDGLSTSSRPTTCCLAYDSDRGSKRASAVVEPVDGEVLEEVARYLGEAGSVTALRDEAETPSVVVHAALRQFAAWGVVELRRDEYVRCVRVPQVEAAILEALRLSPGGLSHGGLARAVSCPASLIEWSIATLHEAGVVVERGHYVVLATEPRGPLTEQQVDDLVEAALCGRGDGPYPVPTIARWAMLPVATTRDSLRRLVEAGRMHESNERYRHKSPEKPAKAKASKAKAKPAKGKTKSKASAESAESAEGEP